MGPPLLSGARRPVRRAAGEALAAVLEVVLPGRCPGCGRPGEPLCDRCGPTVRAAPVAPPPPGVDWWVAACAYEGVARELVARVKYRNARAAVPWCGRVVAAAVRAAARAPQPAVVTWVPGSRERRRARGLDHGALLARAVACELGLPVRPLLARAPGVPQTGRAIVDRRQGPSLWAPAPVLGSAVLLVDDVATTGAILAAAARALRRAGATSVAAATVARTPGRV